MGGTMRQMTQNNTFELSERHQWTFGFVTVLSTGAMWPCAPGHLSGLRPVVGEVLTFFTYLVKVSLLQ